MTGNISTQSSSDSTYCSELENKEELKNLKKFKINFKPPSTLHIRSVETFEESTTRQETFEDLESKCKEKLQELTKYYEESLEFHTKLFCSQENGSPPLLTSTHYTQYENSLPCTQEYKVKLHDFPLLQPILGKSQANSPKQHIINQKDNQNCLNRTYTRAHHKLRDLAAHEDMMPYNKLNNKIFQTEEKFDSLKHKNDDTLSITSENVSKLVDREIEVHRKKQRIRNSKQKSQNGLSQSRYQQDQSCPCFAPAANYQHHLRPSSIVGNQYRNFNTKHSFERNSLASLTTQITKKYKLTNSHVDKLATYFQISTKKLVAAIESILNGDDIGEQPSDESDEISCSQSPIRRRYNSSQ